MVVNNENPVADLSIDQLAQIFKKEITNWADVGGEDGEIVVIGRGGRFRHPRRLREHRGR